MLLWLAGTSRLSESSGSFCVHLFGLQYCNAYKGCWVDICHSHWKQVMLSLGWANLSLFFGVLVQECQTSRWMFLPGRLTLQGSSDYKLKRRCMHCHDQSGLTTWIGSWICYRRATCMMCCFLVRPRTVSKWLLARDLYAYHHHWSIRLVCFFLSKYAT